MIPTRTPLAALLIAVSVVACDPGVIPGEPDARPPDAREPIDAPRIDAPDGTCPVGGTAINPSLVVNDPALLTGFTFARVMDRLRVTAGASATQTPRAIFQAWMRTFNATTASGDCDDASIDPNHYGLACPRAPETKLASVDPFAADSPVQFVPLGLFNRFDLAPADGSNCGEYRVVFSMRSSLASVAGRALLIFEGVLANPTPELGVGACLPVAQFWQGLSSDPSPASRAAKLERFYFDGTAVPGFGPVITAQSYGLALGSTAAHGAGQIRTNFFIDSVEWQLREFKLRRTCADPNDATTCRLVVEHVTVKANPADELFAGGHARSASFESQFLAQLSRLTVTDVAAMSLAPADQFNEFESVSSRAEVDYTRVVSFAFQDAVRTRLTQMGSFLAPEDILRRATTQTCAGCHQQSNSVPLGGGLVWPPSLEFTHIDENHRLSPALTQAFLPRRRAVLQAFINARCGVLDSARIVDGIDLSDAAVRAAAAEGLTLGGSAVGAPN